MAKAPADPNGPTFRTQRLKLAWLAALPFFYLAHPSTVLLLAGGLISALGLLLRTLAAGSIHKDRKLAIGGIYGRLRHPLYAGSFMVGVGLSLASGNRWVLLAFTFLFVWLYGKTLEAESRWLGLRFGEEYEGYRRRVPAFVPRLRRESSSLPSSGFRLVLYRRNREWQAVIGTVLGYGLLWVKMVWLQ